MSSDGDRATGGGGAGRHPEQWWAQFPAASDHFDAPYVVETLSELLAPRIGAPLLRREVEIATVAVAKHLARPASPELAELAAAAVQRLSATLARMGERSTNAVSTQEAATVCRALSGQYAAAAAEAEAIVGTVPLQRLFVTALRLERFDIPLTLRLLEHGRSPEEAIRAGALVGRYRWWPQWLLRITTERALAGTLDESTIAALDNCAYASLSPLQAHLARKLLSGDARLIADAAQRLEGLGESDAAGRLRRGDLNTVALAVRLMSV